MSTNYVPLADKMGTQPGNNSAFGGLRRRAVEGGGVPNPRGDSQWDGSVQHVKIVSNAPDEDFQTGRTKAPVFTSEEPQSVNILVDSRSRLVGSTNNPFNFSITLNSNLFRSRFMKVSKVIIPKIPNITKNNNIVNFVVDNGGDTTYQIVIPPGFYNTTSIANTIGNLMSTATGLIFTVSFQALTRTFKVVNANILNPFFFLADSSFFIRGEYMMPFTTFPPTATTALDGKLEWNSGVSALLYTRYIFVCSTAFNTYSFADSRTNDLSINEDVIAIADLTSIYSADDWDIGRPFAGGVSTVETPNAPNVSLRNPQRNLSPLADIYVQDEYGIDLNESFDLDFGSDEYPANNTGIAFWAEVTFP